VNKKIRDEIKKEVMRTEIVKPALYAQVCDACDKIFDMKSYCNDDPPAGEMIITFDKRRINKGGNFGVWTVCSFNCAQRIFDGEWKKSDHAIGFRQHSKPVRFIVTITPFIKDELQLIKEWEEKD